MLWEDMENLYKDALRKLRSPKNNDYSDFSLDWSYARFELASEQSLPVSTQQNSQEPVAEKKNILESFAQFTQEKLQESPVYNFQGGQIKETLKPEHKGVLASNEAEFLELEQRYFKPEMIQKRFETKSIGIDNKVKVCFVSDVFLSHPDSVDSAQLAELNCFFDQEVASLFNKMIAAMGLSFDNYFVSALCHQSDEETSLLDNLINEILYLKPDFIVTLGAKAVNELLKTNKRLKSIHGQFFELNFEDQNATISKATLMPLFSPKLLHIAPNMKQTAWKDMQKLMEKLTKFEK